MHSPFLVGFDGLNGASVTLAFLSASLFALCLASFKAAGSCWYSYLAVEGEDTKKR